MLATFALVIPAELPDKTFISCIVMASRHRPLPVWIGGAAALILQAAIAVVAGRLLVLLPQTAVHSVVAALFIGGAVWLIFVPERHEEERGEQLAEEEEAATAARAARAATSATSATSATAADGAEAVDETHGSASIGTETADALDAGAADASRSQVVWRPMLATFTVVALAEFGDITQILIANLTARFRDPWGVFIGAAVAFVVVSGVGVVGGRAIIRVVPLSVVRRLSGVALLGFGIYTIVELL